MADLGPLPRLRLTDHDAPQQAVDDVGFVLLSFRKWSASNLVRNILRGVAGRIPKPGRPGALGNTGHSGGVSHHHLLAASQLPAEGRVPL